MLEQINLATSFSSIVGKDLQRNANANLVATTDTANKQMLTEQNVMIISDILQATSGIGPQKGLSIKTARPNANPKTI